MTASLTRQPSIAVFEAAAKWYVQLKEAPDDPSRRHAWREWLERRPEHRRAWERLQVLERRLGGLPKEVAIPALAGADDGRRAAIKTLIILMAAVPVAWLGHRNLPWREWGAEVRTATGERRAVTLADGSFVQLNTATALNIAFSDSMRLIGLVEGEILVNTAKDSHDRPFLVETAHGTIRALGTRLSVRIRDDLTQVGVLEHAVMIQPKDAGQTPTRLEAGHGVSFSNHRIEPSQSIDTNTDAWTRGMLVALDWRLDRFIAELSRYHAGHLGCDPAIGALRVSGAFRLDDINGVLDNLAATLPVQIKSFTPYWVRIVPL